MFKQSNNSTTTASASEQNPFSTIVSSIASTLPPILPRDNFNEDLDGEEDEDEDGGKNGGCGGDDSGGVGVGAKDGIVDGAVDGAVDGNQWKPLAKENAGCWQHFDKGEIGGKVKAKCHYCQKHLAANTINGTKALNMHYKRCSRRKVADSSQKVLTQSFMTGGGKKKLEAYTFDQNSARRELACMMIMHEYPLSMVEHIGFKRFAKAIQPLFEMVSRNTPKADIFI